jgi:hypothetical protein
MSTYTPIASQTLSSAASSVIFSNIPQDYTDLVLVVAGTYTTGGTNDAALQFNSDTGSNYSWTRLLGNGSAASSSRSTNDVQIDFGLISSTNQSNSIAQIQNYSNSTTYKTVLGRGNSTEYVGAIVGTWRNTAPITSITVRSAATYSSGSTFSLYGIQAGTPKAQGGQIVTTDGTYWYHAFTASSTFTPSSDITANILVIGGGASAGKGGAGGGGAGGIFYATSQSLLAGTPYTCIVGGGGASKTTYGKGVNGNDSQFSSLTAAIGGGAGGSNNDSTNGSNGGCGGGSNALSGYSGGSSTQTGTGGTGYGSAGGNYVSSNSAGGGGGAGQAGNTNGGSRGGDGLNTWSTWATATNTGVSGYYAGGGGGASNNLNATGAGGLGGGGGDGVSGTVNTGSGGGAPWLTTNSGAGGSGIVIVRYAV